MGRDEIRCIRKLTSEGRVAREPRVGESRVAREGEAVNDLTHL